MEFSYISDHQVSHSAGGYSLSPRWFLTWFIYPFFQDWLHWWVLILHKNYDHWSVAVLTVTEHFIYSHFWFFSDWLLSPLNSIWLPPFVFFSLWWWISPIFVITKWSALLVSIHFPRGGFLTWYIYPFFQDWLHWWVLILHKTYDHWSLAVLTVTEHFIYSHFWFSFKLVAFCTEFNLFTLICFVLFMLADFLYICDHQAGYSAFGYSLSPRCFLTWYIYPFFQDWLHWWVQISHKTYDHWSVAVLIITDYFICSHFWFFFQIGCFLHWIQCVYLHLFCSLYDDGFSLDLWSPSGLLCWWIFIVPEVVLNLVYLSIFLGLAALMSADIAQNV